MVDYLLSCINFYLFLFSVDEGIGDSWRQVSKCLPQAVYFTRRIHQNIDFTEWLAFDYSWNSQFDCGTDLHILYTLNICTYTQFNTNTLPMLILRNMTFKSNFIAGWLWYELILINPAMEFNHCSQGFQNPDINCIYISFVMLAYILALDSCVIWSGVTS